MQTESFPAGYLEQLSVLSGMDVPRYLQSMDAPRAARAATRDVQNAV